MHTGFSAYTCALCQRPGADTEETGRYDLAWKDLCGIRMLSVNNVNYKGIVISFMFMDICNPSENSC